MRHLEPHELDPAVERFLSTRGADRQADCDALVAMMHAASGEPAAMWGSSIVGFGRYRYRYDSGRTGESALVGFSPRSKEFVLYLGDGFASDGAALDGLGRHRTGQGCLYIRRLEEVDSAVLRGLVDAAVARHRAAD